VPTFAEYVPVVSATVTDGTRKADGSYWNRVVEQWGTRRLDEPTPSEIKQLVAYVRANVMPRRNARGGRSAAENLIAALRCLYKRAEEDGFIDERDNRARWPSRAVCRPPAGPSPMSGSRPGGTRERCGCLSGRVPISSAIARATSTTIRERFSTDPP
jgi:integrase/recombinase XerC